MKNREQAGAMITNKKFGYIQKREDENPKRCSLFPVPDGEKFTVIKRMFALALQGYSADNIDLILKREFPNIKFSGSGWSDRKLRDSFYYGKWVIKAGKKDERSVDLRQITLPDGTKFEPAVSELDFESIQVARKHKRNTQAVRKRISPLPGLVRCKNCGRTMSPAYRKIKQAGGGRVEKLGFECNSKSLDKPCSQGRIKADVIFEAIENALNNCTSKLNKKTYQNYLLGLQLFFNQKTKDNKSRKARVASELRSKIEERKDLIEQRALLIREQAYDKYSKLHFDSQIEGLSAEIEALQQERREGVDGQKAKFRSFTNFLELKENLGLYWKSATYEQKATLAKILILNLEISGQEVAQISIKKPFT